jgi:hypothetical protein
MHGAVVQIAHVLGSGMSQPILEQTCGAALRAQVAVAIASEGVLACLLPGDSGLAVAAEQYRMQIGAGRLEVKARPPEWTQLFSDRPVFPATSSAALEAFRVLGLCHPLSVRTTRRLAGQFPPQVHTMCGVALAPWQE